MYVNTVILSPQPDLMALTSFVHTKKSMLRAFHVWPLENWGNLITGPSPSELQYVPWTS